MVCDSVIELHEVALVVTLKVNVAKDAEGHDEVVYDIDGEPLGLRLKDGEALKLGLTLGGELEEALSPPTPPGLMVPTKRRS